MNALRQLSAKWRKNGNASRSVVIPGKTADQPTPAGVSMLTCAEELDALAAVVETMAEALRDRARTAHEAFVALTEGSGLHRLHQGTFSECCHSECVSTRSALAAFEKEGADVLLRKVPTQE